MISDVLWDDHHLSWAGARPGLLLVTSVWLILHFADGWEKWKKGNVFLVCCKKIKCSKYSVNRAIADSFVSHQRNHYIYFSGFPNKKPTPTPDFKRQHQFKLKNGNILFSKHWHKVIDVYPWFSLFPAQQKQFGKVCIQLWDVWVHHKPCMVSFCKIECWEVTSVQWSRKVRGLSQIFDRWWAVQQLMGGWCYHAQALSLWKNCIAAKVLVQSTWMAAAILIRAWLYEKGN